MGARYCLKREEENPRERDREAASRYVKQQERLSLTERTGQNGEERGREKESYRVRSILVVVFLGQLHSDFSLLSVVFSLCRWTVYHRLTLGPWGGREKDRTERECPGRCSPLQHSHTDQQLTSAEDNQTALNDTSF